jgi:hypothetical protein
MAETKPQKSVEHKDEPEMTATVTDELRAEDPNDDGSKAPQCKRSKSPGERRFGHLAVGAAE